MSTKRPIPKQGWAFAEWVAWWGYLTYDVALAPTVAHIRRGIALAEERYNRTHDDLLDSTPESHAQGQRHSRQRHH